MKLPGYWQRAEVIRTPSDSVNATNKSCFLKGDRLWVLPEPMIVGHHDNGVPIVIYPTHLIGTLVCAAPIGIQVHFVKLLPEFSVEVEQEKAVFRSI